ncbi:ATP-binding cassette sub- G member 2 [Podila minutissima]|uniref:ATP-binding cassette sub- G member 2 n=1 Tax=Podila minutissima TaxID=64525 RepID=A0A9P5ST51_9FUNG|nr:ATP-binding cassette sub- G member 2 [Podila minutissima]
MEMFTVLETLTFAAKLRLPDSMSNQDKIARIHAVVQELNLIHIKDIRVGGAAFRGISGGEKRRVFIGIELLSSPSVLLLDEPTSGFSSTGALNVTNAIKDLAASGRNVILSLFDDLLLLSQGKVGKAQSAASYFENLGHECPVNWNVADYLLDLFSLHQESSSNEKSVSHEDFALKYSNYLSTNPQASLTQLLKEHENKYGKIGGEALLSKFKKEYTTKYTTEYATIALTQTLLITQRSLTNLARHPLIFQADAAIHIIFALVVGSLFSGLKDGPEMDTISLNKSIALFFITSFLATITFAAMPQFTVERSVFLRERAAGMYRTSSCFMAKTIVETLSYSILPAIFIVITYYFIGLSGPLTYYFILTAVFVNVALSPIAAIGAHAMNAEVGMVVLVLINTMAMLFSGFIY